MFDDTRVFNSQVPELHELQPGGGLPGCPNGSLYFLHAPDDFFESRMEIRYSHSIFVHFPGTRSSSRFICLADDYSQTLTGYAIRGDDRMVAVHRSG
jgi:hypothetical protein